VKLLKVRFLVNIINSETVKKSSKINKQSDGWEFKIGKKLGYKASGSSYQVGEEKTTVEIRKTKHGIDFKPSEYIMKLNDKNLMKKDRGQTKMESVNLNTSTNSLHGTRNYMNTDGNHSLSPHHSDNHFLAFKAKDHIGK